MALAPLILAVNRRLFPLVLRDRLQKGVVEIDAAVKRLHANSFIFSVCANIVTILLFA